MWTVTKDDTRGASYRWCAEHPDKGEHYFPTKRAAVRFVQLMNGERNDGPKLLADMFNFKR